MYTLSYTLVSVKLPNFVIQRNTGWGYNITLLLTHLVGNLSTSMTELLNEDDTDNVNNVITLIIVFMNGYYGSMHGL